MLDCTKHRRSPFDQTDDVYSISAALIRDPMPYLLVELDGEVPSLCTRR